MMRKMIAFLKITLIILAFVFVIVAIEGIGWRGETIAGITPIQKFSDLGKITSDSIGDSFKNMKGAFATMVVGLVLMAGALIPALLEIFTKAKFIKFITFGVLIGGFVLMVIGAAIQSSEFNKNLIGFKVDNGMLAGLWILILIPSLLAVSYSWLDFTKKSISK